MIQGTHQDADPVTVNCIFCAIVAGSSPVSLLYRDEQVMAFLDIRPITPGHLLVVPIGHATALADLDPAVGAELFRVGQRAAAALRRGDIGGGVNFFLADGEVAGQEVFHVHLHVIPRTAGDGFSIGGRFTSPPRSVLHEQAALLRRWWPDIE